MESNDLKKAGLKITLPRMTILQFFEKSPQKHMSAEEVYKALLETGEDIGLATVYRVLTQFEAAGLITRHHFEGGHSVFELDKGGHHDHIVCEDCGRIEEFYDETIEQRQNDIATERKFKIASHAMILYGRCQRKNCPHAKDD